MKFNGKKFSQIMQDRDMTVEEVSFKTGLLPKSVNFILESGYASNEAMERLAEVVDLPVKEFLATDVGDSTENVIEFVKDSERATVTISQGRYKSRIKKLAKSHPEECQILSDNNGKVIYAHIPVAWIRIIPRPNLTDEQRKACADRAKTFLH